MIGRAAIGSGALRSYRSTKMAEGQAHQPKLMDSEYAAKTFHGKSMKPGGGGRFAKAVAAGAPPGAMAAKGREKYGKKKFQKMAKAGAKRAAAKKGK